MPSAVGMGLAVPSPTSLSICPIIMDLGCHWVTGSYGMVYSSYPCIGVYDITPWTFSPSEMPPTTPVTLKNLLMLCLTLVLTWYLSWLFRSLEQHNIYNLLTYYISRVFNASADSSRRRALCFRVVQYVRPSVEMRHTYFVWRSICVLSGRISMKLGRNIHHVSRHCWKGFRGQRSRSQGDQLTVCFLG